MNRDEDNLEIFAIEIIKVNTLPVDVIGALISVPTDPSEFSLEKNVVLIRQ